MLLAALGDCLGNIHAARAVLDDIADRGILTILNTGNAVMGFPWPQDTADLLREHGVQSAQGDLDRAAARALRDKKSGDTPETRAAAYAHGHLTAATLEALRTLPLRPTITLEQIAITWFCGTATSQRERLDPHGSAMRYQRIREDVRTPLIVCGKHPEPYTKWIDDTLFVCPGSAGLGATARYALINTETTPWSVEFPEITYETRSIADALAEASLDDPASWVYTGSSRNAPR